MGDALFTPTAPSVRFTDTDDEVTFTATSPRVTFTTGPIVAAGSGVSALDDLSDVTLSSPSSGQVLKYNGTAWVNGTDSGGGAADVACLRVGVMLTDPTLIGGSYNAGTDRWTVSALSTAPTTGDARLLAVLGDDPNNIAAASTGLFEHIGSGVFSRVRAWASTDIGTWAVSAYELNPGDGSPVAWMYADADTGDLAYSLLVQYTDEMARDAIGLALSGGTGISIAPNDPGDSITISSTITQYTDEMARDALGSALTAGTGIAITPNDDADTITVTSTITQYTDEMARDALGAALVAGSNITITPNDGADTITIAASSSGSGVPGGASTFGGNQGYHLPGVFYTALANAVALTANRIWYVPFMIRSGTLTVDRMHCEVTTGVAASNLRMGVYAADSTWQPTGAALIDVTATSATSGQSRNVTVSSVALTAGRYLACIVSDAAISVRSAAAINSWGSDHGATQVTSPTSAQVLTARYVNLTYPASLPNTGPAWSTVTATATPAAAGNDPVLLLRGTYS